MCGFRCMHFFVQTAVKPLIDNLVFDVTFTHIRRKEEMVTVWVGLTGQIEWKK